MPAKLVPITLTEFSASTTQDNIYSLIFEPFYTLLYRFSFIIPFLLLSQLLYAVYRAKAMANLWGGPQIECSLTSQDFKKR